MERIMTGQSRRMFGPIDPYCLLPVVPMVTVGVMLAVAVQVVLGIALIAVALLILALDSWANRRDTPPHANRPYDVRDRGRRP
jgi:hypothetical protein